MMNTGKPEKAYCCGNSAQREALLISKFDIVVSILGLLGFIIFATLLAVSHGTFTDVESNGSSSNESDFVAFLHWPGVAKGFMITFWILSYISGTVFAVVLFFGAKRRNHKFLKIWFIGTSIVSSLSLLVAFGITLFAMDKTLLSVTMLSVLLYRWYCLWIVYVLMKESGSVIGYSDAMQDVEYSAQEQEPDIADKF